MLLEVLTEFGGFCHWVVVKYDRLDVAQGLEILYVL